MCGAVFGFLDYNELFHSKDPDQASNEIFKAVVSVLHGNDMDMRSDAAQLLVGFCRNIAQQNPSGISTKYLGQAKKELMRAVSETKDPDAAKKLRDCQAELAQLANSSTK